MEYVALETITAAIGLGVTAYAAGTLMSIPPILFYLLAGVAVGPMGANLLDVGTLGDGLLVLVEFAVAIILFEGGIMLTTKGFLKAPSAIGRLLTVTILLTALGGALLAHYILGLSWKISFVFGAIVVVTGPTVIRPLLKSVRLSQKLESLLHWEAIWGDVIGVMLAAFTLKIVSVSSFSGFGDASMLLLISAVVGGGVGSFSGHVLSRHILVWTAKSGDSGLAGIVSFAAALVTFAVSNAIASGSGPLAVAVAGFFLARQKGDCLRSIRHFKDQLSVIVIGTLFVLLSASIDFRHLETAWPRMLLVAVILGGIVRPLAVEVALWGTRVSFRERLYVGLIGPRGIISLATAAYAVLQAPAFKMEMDILLGTIFIVVFISGTVTTLLGAPLASLLGVGRTAESGGVAIIGTNAFSIALAEQLRSHVKIVFFDPRPDRCELVQKQGLTTFCTELLDDGVYEEAVLEGYTRVIALTGNDALNRLVVHTAQHHFGVENVFRARVEKENAPEIGFDGSERMAFGKNFNLPEAISRVHADRACIHEVETRKCNMEACIPLVEVHPEGDGITIVNGTSPDVSEDAFRLVVMSLREADEPCET